VVNEATPVSQNTILDKNQVGDESPKALPNGNVGENRDSKTPQRPENGPYLKILTQFWKGKKKTNPLKEEHQFGKEPANGLAEPVKDKEISLTANQGASKDQQSMNSTDGSRTHKPATIQGSSQYPTKREPSSR
jgi:hypothetical protein